MNVPRSEKHKGESVIQVLMVDDERLFADVIATILDAAGMQVVAVATTAAEGLKAARRHRPELALLDLHLPDGSGLELGRQILDEMPDTKVLALTAVRESKAVGETLRSGFHGYVTKDTPLTNFVPLINAAMNGQVVIPHRVAAAAAGARSKDERHAAMLAEQLSPREREVLAQLVEGATSPEMADRFGVSPNTIRTHVQSILTKLQVHSRLEAATYAVRYGLIDVPSSPSRRYA